MFIFATFVLPDNANVEPPCDKIMCFKRTLMQRILGEGVSNSAFILQVVNEIKSNLASGRVFSSLVKTLKSVLAEHWAINFNPDLIDRDKCIF